MLGWVKGGKVSYKDRGYDEYVGGICSSIVIINSICVSVVKYIWWVIINRKDV